MNFARLRFATAVVVTAGGAFLGTGAFLFSQGTESWLGLGVGAGLAIITLLAFLTAGRGAVQRGLDLLLVPICLWTLISARTVELAGHGASEAQVKWLGLSSGAAMFAIGAVALIAHELTVESDLAWARRQLSGSVPAPAEATPAEPSDATERNGNGAENGSGNGNRPVWISPVVHHDDPDDWRPRRRA